MKKILAASAVTLLSTAHALAHQSPLGAEHTHPHGETVAWLEYGLAGLGLLAACAGLRMIAKRRTKA